MLFGDVLGCLRESLGVFWLYFAMLKLLGSLWGLFEGSVHAGLSRAEANPPFWQNSEMKELFHLIIMRHQNNKTAALKLSKNHWVRPFFAIFRLLREVLFVTVAFDHPVA